MRVLGRLAVMATATTALLAAACQAKAPTGGEATATPTVAQAQAATPAPEAPPPSPPLAAPLEAGSKEARDQLYCAGLISAANPAPLEALPPVAEARLQEAEMFAFVLADEGFQKLVAEGAAKGDHRLQVIDAWTAEAARELKAGETRTPLEACMEWARDLATP